MATAVATGGAAMGSAVATGGLPWVVSTGRLKLSRKFTFKNLGGWGTEKNRNNV